MTDVSELIDQEAKAIEDDVIGWRQAIHQDPELPNREAAMAKRVRDHLSSLGLEVTTGVAGHGVIGLLKGGKPGDKVMGLRRSSSARQC